MANMLCVVFVEETKNETTKKRQREAVGYWYLEKLFVVDYIPPEDGLISFDEDFDSSHKVSSSITNPSTNTTQITLDVSLETLACWLIEIPGWEIFNEEEFRKDEAAVWHYIKENYEEGAEFTPRFKNKASE